MPGTDKPGVSAGIMVAIPVYNHAATLRRVAQGSLAVHRPVMVVDDGSDDGAEAAVAGLDVVFSRHEVNRGKGAAILTAAEEACRRGARHIIVLDADGQHDPADIPKFISAVAAAPDAVVVGRRDLDRPSVPGASRFGRSFSNFWFRLQTGCRLGDTQSGFRAYPVGVLERLNLRERGFGFEVEVLVKAAWAGVPVIEIPVSAYYPPSGERVSHFHRLWDNARLSRLNTRLTLRAILPWPHRRLIPGGGADRAVSVLHPLRSIRALLAERSTPSQLALAAFAGVFIGALPLPAMHTVAVLLAASFLRLNRLFAVAASQLCMPPLVPALAVEAGYYMRHGRFLTELSLRTVGYEAVDRIVEWFLGSLALAPALAALVGAAVYLAAAFISRRTGVRSN